MMMKHLKRACTGLLAAGLMSAPAWAEIIHSVTGDELEAALEAAGLEATIIKDSATGAPVASGQAGEFKFFVRALSCSGTPPSCSHLIFFANFDLGREADSRDLEIADDFRDGQLFGRAYVLESKNQVGVDYVIELDGGVTKEHLAENIGRWADIIAAFVDKFRAGRASS